MTKIIWLGNPFFAPCIEHPNFSVRMADFAAGEHFNWRALHEKFALSPSDILVVADKSLPPPVLNVEQFPCLTILYVVDSHIHSWYPYYAQAFDLCLVSLKDHLPLFRKGRLTDEQLVWMPPYCIPSPISPDSIEAVGKKWDLLFVGTVDPQVNPERVLFMRELQRLMPAFHYCAGHINRLYPKARLILNHSIDGDLNFRVFEALGSGACLLTPQVGHGLTDLFGNGEDLFIYDQKNIPALAEFARRLLLDDQTRLRVARSGFSKVTGLHLARHRADMLVDMLLQWQTNGTDQRLIRQRLKEADSIHRNYLRLIYLLLADNLPELPELRAAYLAAAAKND